MTSCFTSQPNHFTSFTKYEQFLNGYIFTQINPLLYKNVAMSNIMPIDSKIA